MLSSGFFRTINYVTFKVTKGCNLKCSYCNMEVSKASTPGMSIETFKVAAQLVIENSVFSTLGIEFHGGEPLLLPDDWFEEATAFCREKGKVHSKVIQHPMQTNGVLADESRVSYLHGLGIRFGVSYDGPPELNDVLRGGGDKVEKNLAHMVKNGILGGVLTVLSKANFEYVELLMDRLEQLGIRGFRFNFLASQGWGLAHYLSAEEMYIGMVSALKHMHRNNCSVVESGIRRYIVRFLTQRESRPKLSCWEHQCQAGRTFVAISPEGGVYACGTDLNNHQLGNVFDRHFSDDHVRNSLEALHEKGAWYSRCYDCPAKKICNLGCPTSDFNSDDYRNQECLFTKAFYEFMTNNYDMIASVGRMLCIQ